MGTVTSRTVTSLTNPTVKAVRALHMRKERDDTGLFVAEGLKTVIEGVETGHAPKILMYGQGAADHPLLQNAMRATLQARGEVIEVTQDILAKVSRREIRKPWWAYFLRCSGRWPRLTPGRHPVSSPCTGYGTQAIWEPSSAPPTPPAAAG